MARMRERAGRIVLAIEARRRRLIAGWIRRLRPRVVFDVGCEDGWIAQHYVERVESLVLVDLDPATLAASALAAHPSVRTAVADATDAADLERAFGTCRADVIVLSALLEHLPRPADTLVALRAFLAPGGRFLVYLPADAPILLAKRVLSWSRLAGLVRGLSLEPAPGHLHDFDRRGVARLAARGGRLEMLSFDPLCLGYLAVVRRD